MSVTIKQTFYWGIAAIALVALAAPFPGFATGLTLLLIFGVLVTHYSTYLSYLTPPK